MSWRPPNWSETREKYAARVAPFFPGDYEAGADAMLEALKERGIYGIVSGDLECFCLDPVGEPEPSRAFDNYETWRAWADKRKYPDDLVADLGHEKKVWLIAIPDEG